jgi:hypothetical protein
MDDYEPLGPGKEHHIAQCVADGTASREEARRLLEEFVRQVSTGAVSPRMLEHFGECIRAYLVGKKVLEAAPAAGRNRRVGVPVQTLEKAFGLTRIAPGKPRIDDDTLSIVAAAVLDLLLSGSSLEDAAMSVAEDRKARGETVSSETQVRGAWASHKLGGACFLRLGRSLDGEAWTPAELARLNEIFYGVQGFVPPGMPVADYWKQLLPREPLPQNVTPEYPPDKSA